MTAFICSSPILLRNVVVNPSSKGYNTGRQLLYRTTRIGLQTGIENYHPPPLQTLSIITSSSSSSNGLQVLPQSTMMITTTSSTTTGIELEPMVPGPFEITAFGITVIVCSIAGWVWANQVVPVSRTKLAISKKRGAVRTYLNELKNDNYSADATTVTTYQDIITTPTTTISSTDLESVPNNIAQNEILDNTIVTTDTIMSNKTNNNKKTNRAFEKWLFTDWLEQDLYRERNKGGRQKESALPFLKQAKWNSGDNPILVATALIASGVIVSSIIERILTV